MSRTFLNRRELLKLSAGSLLALGLWPGRRAYADSWPAESFKIAVLNDLHAMSPECGPWLERIAADVKTHSPRFCVLAGDLTDTADPHYMDLVHSIFSKVGCPLHVLIGNHDWVSKTDRSTFEARFPNSINYLFKEGSWQCLALDTTEGTSWEKTKISNDTLSWVDSNLSGLSKTLPTIVFTHFPLGAGVRMRPSNADALLERFLHYNVQAVFSGHFHGYTERSSNGTMLFTDKCCALKRFNHDGTKEKGYFICTLKDGTVEHEFIQMNEKVV